MSFDTDPNRDLRQDGRGAPSRRRGLVLLAGAATVAAAMALPARAPAQERRVASPAGAAATQVGGRYDVRAGYVGGKWIEMKFGRPIKRGRDLFGPDDFVEFLNDGADIWRAGANFTTRLITEAPLAIAGTRVAAGEYTVFVALARDEWTFVLSTWPAQKVYDYENKEALFGAYYYTPDRDVLRAPMHLETLPWSFDQLSWQFLDVGEAGGKLALVWDDRLAWVPFSVAAD